MSLTITVRKNTLTAAINPWCVRSTTSDVVDRDRLIDLMAEEGTTLTKTDILAAMNLHQEVLRKLLIDGKTIKTQMGSFYLCASGSMAAEDEAFLPDTAGGNHDIRIHFRPDSAFEEAVRAAVRIVRDEVVDKRSPSIHVVESTMTGKPGTTRPGDVLRLTGLRLKFDPANPMEGLFLIGEGGSILRCASYPLILPKTLLACIPADLAPGTFSLALRSLAGGKDLREAVWIGLTVEA
jgi:hypothetical protein